MPYGKKNRAAARCHPCCREARQQARRNVVTVALAITICRIVLLYVSATKRIPPDGHDAAGGEEPRCHAHTVDVVRRVGEGRGCAHQDAHDTRGDDHLSDGAVIRIGDVEVRSIACDPVRAVKAGGKSRHGIGGGIELANGIVSRVGDVQNSADRDDPLGVAERGGRPDTIRTSRTTGLPATVFTGFGRVPPRQAGFPI